MISPITYLKTISMEGSGQNFNGSDFLPSATQRSSQNNLSNQNNENQLIMDGNGTTDALSAAEGSKVQGAGIETCTSILVRRNHAGLGSGVEAAMERLEKKRKKNREYRERIKENYKRLEEDLQVKLQENAALNQNLLSVNTYILQLLEKKKRLEEDLQVKIQENAALHQNLQSANADIADRKKAEEELLQKLQSTNTTIEKLEQQLEGTQSVSHQLVLPENYKRLEEDHQVKLQENAALNQNLQSANAYILQLLANRKKAEEELLQKLQSANTRIEKLKQQLESKQSVSHQRVLPKAVLEVDIKDHRELQKVMEVVASFSGIDSIAISVTEKKLTITGDEDPVDIVSKLRNTCNTRLLSFGLAKEEKKKEECKKKSDQMEPNSSARLTGEV